MMRSGTSRGPYFLRSELLRATAQTGFSEDLSEKEVNAVLDVVGSGESGQLSGLGGNSAVSSKACVVAPGRNENHVIFHFLQCGVEERSVDWSHGDCGNMLAGVGVFALLEKIVVPKLNEKRSVGTVRVSSHQTRKEFEVDIPLKKDLITPDLKGKFEIDGIKAKGAPIQVNSMEPQGAMTGTLWPAKGMKTSMLERENMPVTCIDCARCLVIVGNTAGEFEKQNLEVTEKLERIRCEAALEMGLGDVSGKVSPKICVVFPHAEESTLKVKYFVAPARNEVHPTLAMTAGQALAVASLCEGTIPFNMMKHSNSPSSRVSFEHGKGKVSFSVDWDGSELRRTGYTRTVDVIARCERTIV